MSSAKPAERGTAISARTLEDHRRRQAAGRPGRGRLRPLLAWGGGILLAAAVLMFCYLRIAGTQAVDSDGAANALQAWDMLHGDLLLHGWWVTDVSFYTTELPQYMLVEAVAGLHPEVVHICAALTYTLLVLLAAFVARGRARGAEGVVRALLAAGIMLAPEPGAATGVLLSNPDHVGTAVPVLVLLLLLDWARPRWYVPAATAVLLTLAIVGDPLAIVIGVLPLVAVCMARVCLPLLRRRVPPQPLWFEFSLACAAIAAVPAAAAVNHFVVALHGFSTNPGNTRLQPLSTLQSNVAPTVRGILSLFGADIVSAPGGLGKAFAVVHLAGVLLVLAAVVLAGWGLLRSLWSIGPDAAARRAVPGDMVADLLVVAVALNVLAFFFLYRVKTIYSAHEIGPVVSLGAALAGRVLGGPLLRARLLRVRLLPALAAGLACYCVMLGFAAARTQAPPSNAAVTVWLTRHHLRSGLAPYWQATSVTLDSGGTIAMGSVLPARGGLAPWHWEADMRDVGPGHTADFLLTMPGETVTPAVAEKAFGKPARVYRYQGYIIMVWHENLVPRLGRPVS